MDPRLEVPFTAGEKIKIRLLSGYIWEVPRPSISPIEPYLYPDRPGRRYNNEDPIFHLGSEDYYFALDHYSRLMVVFMSGDTVGSYVSDPPQIILPETAFPETAFPEKPSKSEAIKPSKSEAIESGLVRVPLRVQPGQKDHVWAVPKGFPIDWTEEPSGYSQTGLPWYHVVDSDSEYNLYVEIDRSHTPPWAVVHKMQPLPNQLAVKVLATSLIFFVPFVLLVTSGKRL